MTHNRGGLSVLAISVLGTTLPLFAEDAARWPLQATTTQRVDFAPGGLIRVTGSFGNLNVEGWDRPEVEITVVKSILQDLKPKERDQAAQILESVHIMGERKSDTELSISTMVPDRRFFKHPRRATDGLTLEYQIRAPRDSRLAIQHGTGYVFVSDMTGDVEASVRRGDIMLMLPDSGSYSIDAKSRFGLVSSDFTGDTHRARVLGERFARDGATPAHKLVLRMGFGGITIKALPPESSPLSPQVP